MGGDGRNKRRAARDNYSINWSRPHRRVIHERFVFFCAVEPFYAVVQNVRVLSCNRLGCNVSEFILGSLMGNPSCT